MTEPTRSRTVEANGPAPVPAPVPVAIIGMGCLFPGASDLTRYWASIRGRRDAIAEVPETHWRVDDYFDPDPKAPDRTYARRGGFLAPVDFPALEFGIAPNNLDATDTTQLLGLLAARAALDDAGYGAGSGRTFDRSRVSVILGVTGTLELVIPLGARLGHPIWRRALRAAGVGDDVAEDVVRRISESYVGWQENSFPGLLGNVAAGRIANRLDLGGTNCVIDAACASSLGAIDLALHELAAGRSDMVLSGGFDTFNDIFMYMCFSKTPALSPSGDARPFDAAGDGTILGEGLGVVVLKRLDDARRDGDTVYAVIRAVGSSSDGKGGAIYAPSAAGQGRALRRAYTLAGVSPATVELVEAHGTGTTVGDATELAALAEVYGEAGRAGTWCALGSVKSQIGHTKAAAGAAGLIKAALALHHKVLPPTIKVTRPIDQAAPGRSPFYINTEPRPWLARGGHPRRAAVSAFGFGGSNFHCVLEEAGPDLPGIDWDGDVQIVALAADRPDALLAALDAWPRDLAWEALRAEAARSRERFQPAAACRLLLVIERENVDLERTFARARGLAAAGHSSAGEGIFIGSGPAAGPLALLFPGQGSQYVGMLRALACRFPLFHTALAEADRRPLDDGCYLGDLIYPHPAFSDDERAAQEAALRATAVAQPALGAVSLGVLRILEHFGIQPAAAAGHSFGELTALCAAGRIDAAELGLLARTRGQLMAGLGAGSPGDRGAMLAVMAPLESIAAMVRDATLDLVIANKNAPEQAVLSGPAAEIERAARRFQEAGIKTRTLDVAAAFHSRFVAAAQEPFAEALRAVPFGPGRMSVYANATGGLYPDHAEGARALLASQLARPVEFVAQIEAMYRAGIRTFLEAGPDRKLTPLIGAILGGRTHAALAVDASRGQRDNLADLARSLAELAALGHPVHLTLWDHAGDRAPAHSPAPSTRKPGLTVKVCGANPAPRPAPQTQTDESSRPTIRSNPHVDMPLPMTPTPSTRFSQPHERPTPANTNGNGTAPQNGHPGVAVPPAGGPIPDLGSSDPAVVAEALRTVQDNLVTLQKLGEQTAQLHRQFLEGQERTQRTFQRLLEQQQKLVLASLGVDSPTRSETVSHPPAATTRPVAIFSPPGDRVSQPAATCAQEETCERDEGGDVAGIQAVLTAVVAEKTGYPAEMLEPSMRLDADLGIDSIKRVEILAALQEQLPDAPVIKPEHLGTLQTLGDIVEFLAAGGGAEAGPPSSPGLRQASSRGRGEEAARVQEVLTAIVAEKTGYPAEMLEPSMRLDADLGIDSIKRVEILAALQEQLPQAPVIKPEHLGTLQTLGDIVEFLVAGTGAASDPSPSPGLRPPSLGGRGKDVAAPLQRLVVTSTSLDESRPRAPVQLRPGSEVWIAGSDDDALARALADRLMAAGFTARLLVGAEIGNPRPVQLAGLLLVAPARSSTDTTIKDAFRLLRMAAPALRQAGREGGALLATVTQLDGAFGTRGLALDPDADPVAGGLAGLAKTAGHEWPEVACKAIDVDPAFVRHALDRAAEAVLDELFRRGPAEVGLAQEGRSTLELISAALGESTAPLEPGGVVVISGGARGITAEVAVALAETLRPTIVVLGRSAAPEPEPDWLAALDIADETAIKRALAARAGGNGQATPQAIGEEFRRIAAAREIARNVARIEAAGARVVYRAVDVRDAAAVVACLDGVRAEHGPIRGLVHGAGVLADRRIEDQTDDQFAAVYDTKVAGLRSLLAAIGPDADDLRFLVLFSSSTARFGRTGQVAYAAANEVLNKWAQREALRRSRCRVAAINWGPWEGGMVTPALRPLFAAEGIDLIPPGAGARYLVAELQATGPDGHRPPVEVVILGGTALPIGLSPAPRIEPAPSAPAAPPASPALSMVFEVPADVTAIPILGAHVIDGRPVLPLALILEWLALGALQRNPGLAFCGIDDLHLLKGVIVRDDQPETLRVLAGKPTREEGLYRVAVELRGTLDGGREFTHARGRVVLGDRLPAATNEDSDARRAPAPARFDPQAIYSDLLFHGPGLRGIERIEGCGDEGVGIFCRTAPPPARWIERPLRQAWLSDPLAIDCAFQAMVLWSFEHSGACSLPTVVGRYRQFRRSFPGDGVRVVARVTQATELQARADILFSDEDGLLVARIDGYECVIDASLNQAFRRNQLAQVVER
jgi:acyl transferase domain-containing protein/acyl carrier protein/NADP-dependent 3-hydroxy acid dehydrogenase YdfG